jgi:predicted TIM-barrel fold metal-dependent hydrolase
VSEAGLYAGPICDAHLHAWRYDAATYPWLAAAEAAPLRRDWTRADYRAALAGLDVRASVWVEALAVDPLAEAKAAQAMATADFATALVAHAPLDAPDLARRLAALRDLPGLRGIRDIVAPGFARRADLLGTAAFARGLAILAEAGLVFDLLLEPGQMLQAADLIRRLPGLQVVLEHAGTPGDAEAWEPGITALAALPNVAVKLSALHCRVPGWTDASLARLIGQILTLFGPERVMAASDWPAHDRHVPLARSFLTLRRALRGWPEPAQRAVFHDTARRIYRI